MEAKKIDERRGSGGATADNGEDDEKIEAFFELIRSFREARNRREEELNSIEHNNNNNKKKKKIRLIGDKLDESRQWVPAFQWEDFTVDDVLDQSTKLPASSFPGKIEEEKKKHEEEIELDLNLSL